MIIIAMATLVVVLATWLLFSRRRHHRLTASHPNITKTTPKPPPCVPGLPLLGNALPLGKQGAEFLYECWQSYGDAFTLHAAGQKMTFLFAPHSLVYYFRAPESELSFLPAVEQWTERVFGLPPADFLPRHHLILNTTRNLVGRHGAENTHQHAARLLPLLKKGISQWFAETSPSVAVEHPQQPSSTAWCKLELSEAIAKLVFSASVKALFGPAFLQRHGETYLYQAFFDFERCFELAASPIPHFLQLKFKKARKELLDAIKTSYLCGDFLLPEKSATESSHTVVGDLIQISGMPPHAVPNMLLAVLWASQANTVPTAFWTLGFLLLPENINYLKEIRSNLDDKSSNETNSNKPNSVSGGDLDNALSIKLQSLACDSSSLLSKCCMEALRLRSASTDVRIAVKDFIMPLHTSNLQNNNLVVSSVPQNEEMEEKVLNQISQKSDQRPEEEKEILIEKGTMVMICPWISHVDPRLYEDQPDVFNPHRQGAALPCSNPSNNNTNSSNRELHGVAAGVGGLAGLAFGGGKFRCPGRSFAEMELGLVVGLILDELDIELIEKESSPSMKRSGGGGSAVPGDPHGRLPTPDVRRLVGIKVPDGPCWVCVRQRKR